jgi:hypothetical protein
VDTNKQNKTKQNPFISDETKNEFKAFEAEVKTNFPTVAKLEKQMTLNEYYTLRTELKLLPAQITDIVLRMENYKPLSKTYMSVYLTLRQWYKRELKESNSRNTTDLPKHYGR